MSEIVVGVDGSRASKRALAWAVRQAGLTDATVRAVCVVTPPAAGRETPTVKPSTKELRDASQRLLDEAVAEVDGKVITEVTSAWQQSIPTALLEYARHADLLVVGSRGVGGFYGLLLGSVSQQVVQHAPCPVVVVPAPKE